MDRAHNMLVAPNIMPLGFFMETRTDAKNTTTLFGGST